MSNLFNPRPGSYWLAFQATDAKSVEIQDKIVTATFIKAWWNQIPNLYVIESDLIQEELYKEVNDLFPFEIFLMGPFTEGYNGRLPFPKWKHLLNGTPEQIRRLEVITAKKEQEKLEQKN